MKRTLIALCLLMIGAGCAGPTVVSDFNGDSVSIQSNQANAAEDSAALSEATRICSAAGKRAEYASSRQIYAPQYMLPTYEHLFLCLAPAAAPATMTEGPRVSAG